MAENKDSVGPKLSADVAAQQEEEKRLRLIVFRTIVQLSDTVTEKFLLEKLNYLDANSWMEIAEERYLGRLCGYPCCSNAVEIRKHQKYRIDRKNKKVFERSTERDKFCSEQCLARFNGLRFQFDDEPLWLRGTRRRKEFNLDFPIKDKVEKQKPRLPSFEYVEEKIEKQLNNLVVGDSNDTDDEIDNEEPDVKSAEDDEQFINEISNFLSQKACISGKKCSKDKKTANTNSESPKSNKLECASPPNIACARKTDMSNEEKLAKIRSKFGSTDRCRRKGPPIVEAKSLDVSHKSKVDDFDKEILNDLMKTYFGPKTLEFLHNYGSDWVEEMSECERILQQFYRGDQVERKVDEVFMPRIDDLDQKSLRRDVFSRLIKPSFSKLECMLRTRGLYEKAQPLISTLPLDASNVDLKKTDSQLLVALLFSLLAHTNNTIREQFFPDNVPCDMFKKYVENAGCNFNVFYSVVTSYLRDL